MRPFILLTVLMFSITQNCFAEGFGDSGGIIGGGGILGLGGGFDSLFTTGPGHCVRLAAEGCSVSGNSRVCEYGDNYEERKWIPNSGSTPYFNETKTLKKGCFSGAWHTIAEMSITGADNERPDLGMDKSSVFYHLDTWKVIVRPDGTSYPLQNGYYSGNRHFGKHIRAGNAKCARRINRSNSCHSYYRFTDYDDEGVQKSVTTRNFDGSYLAESGDPALGCDPDYGYVTSTAKTSSSSPSMVSSGDTEFRYDNNSITIFNGKYDASSPDGSYSFSGLFDLIAGTSQFLEKIDGRDYQSSSEMGLTASVVTSRFGLARLSSTGYNRSDYEPFVYPMEGNFCGKVPVEAKIMGIYRGTSK